jgi:hypothetical protein
VAAGWSPGSSHTVPAAARGASHLVPGRPNPPNRPRPPGTAAPREAGLGKPTPARPPLRAHPCARRPTPAGQGLRAADQAGFRARRRTSDNILILRHLTDAARATPRPANRPLHVCFVDFEKAYDRIHRDALMQYLATGMRRPTPGPGQGSQRRAGHPPNPHPRHRRCGPATDTPPRSQNSGLSTKNHGAARSSLLLPVAGSRRESAKDSSSTQPHCG